MRSPKLSAAVAVALAVAALSACRTNVGAAAVVEGHRIGESDVARYLTNDAKPVSVQTQAGGTESVAPRTYVLNTLIDDRLYRTLLRVTPKGMPTAGEIAQETEQDLQGETPSGIATKSGLGGYTRAFQQFWVKVQILGQIINKEAQQGVDIRGLAGKLHFNVHVNPRYGAWDKKSFTLSSAAGAGLPSFLKLAPPYVVPTEVSSPTPAS